MDNGQRIENVLNAIPYPDHIKDINLSEESAIKFKWRGTTYRVSGNNFVEEVGDGVLIGSDKCILLEALIKKSRILQDI